MKQLYVIGIAVALVLFLLLGLNKLNLQQASDTAPDNVPAEEGTEEETIEGDTTTNPNQENAMQESASEGNTIVVMKTNQGDITIELFTKDMPITAGNFLELAQSNYFDGIKFHRVIPNFMIQGGDPLTKDDTQAARWGTGGPGYAIQDEFVPGLSNVRGTIAMANSGPNTGGSQFFINLVDNTFLDFDKQPLTSKHPVFGRVIAGMEVVDAIAAIPTRERDIPTQAIVIEDISVQ